MTNKLPDTLEICGCVELQKYMNKEILNKNCKISNIGLFCKIPNTIVHSENILIMNSDKNFAYYWLSLGRFTNLKNIYLFSHFCEYDVLSRWNNKGINMHLQKGYYDGYKSWTKEFEYIKTIDDDPDKIFNI